MRRDVLSKGVFAKLIESLKKLPGIGQKTAQRLAFFILKMPTEGASDIAQAILEVKARLRLCSLCQNISEEPVCEICRDPGRDRTKVLVVKEPSTLYAIERTCEYKGLYHVLLGEASPLDGPTAKEQVGIISGEIRAQALLDRLRTADNLAKIEEVILATDPTMEGEATALYLTKLIKPLGVKVTRIAYGIPVGIDLEYVDEVSLVKSLEGRREF